ncbi:hypothetical protein ACWEV9_35290, partial [Streptomyces albogriseolus]
DATHDDGYKPMWEANAKAGYASLSWDKPGVADRFAWRRAGVSAWSNAPAELTGGGAASASGTAADRQPR